jgi:hypothetical protein
LLYGRIAELVRQEFSRGTMWTIYIWASSHQVLVNLKIFFWSFSHYPIFMYQKFFFSANSC